MFQRIKTWAPLAISLLALFAAFGGVGWAASLIGGKEIAKNSIPLNRLTKAARRALAGKRGPQGAQGIQGLTGQPGPPGPFVGTIPSGKTLVGIYGLRYHATGGGEDYMTAISFGFNLASAPTPYFIPVSSTPPAQCPGTVLNPQATPGSLCVYEGSGTNHSAPFFTDAIFGTGASPFGTNVVMDSTGAGVGGSSGSWAATSP